jgi:hypothetical protein
LFRELSPLRIAADPGYFGTMGSRYGIAVDMRSECGDDPSDQQGRDVYPF